MTDQDSRHRPRKSTTLRAAVVAGLAAGASGALAGTAGAEDTVVVHDPVSTVHARSGQKIAIDPSALDGKLRSAVLLAQPLDLGGPERASEDFDEQSPITLGTASDGKEVYSGDEIADAARSRLSRLDLPPEQTEAVAFHFKNLVSLGTSVTVEGEAAPAPPPKRAEPEPAKEPPKEPARPAPQPSRDTSDERPGQREPQAAPESAPTRGSVPDAARTPQALPAAVQLLPPAHASVPDPASPPAVFVPPTSGTQPSQQPSPQQAQAQAEQQAQIQQQAHARELRAAGKAEAMPIDLSDRVALPVIFAAISVAGVTAALVRSWILHRS